VNALGRIDAPGTETGGVTEATGMTRSRVLGSRILGSIGGAVGAALVITAAAPAAAQSVGDRGAGDRAAQPRAVIELFTSQGCSSCPPADKLLAELRDDSSLVTLSLPIDYWDYLGWKDTLAIPGHTLRQKAYSKARGDREVYTPQVVVNGVAQALGSDRAEIEKAVAQSRAKAKAPSVPIEVAVGDDQVTVTLANATAGAAMGGEVWLCKLSRSETVRVGRGENRGRTLTYTNVVRGWVKLGTWTGKGETLTVPTDAIKSAGIDAVAVILQSGNLERPGAVLGASLASLR
jgi:hypothetical protein